MLHWRPSLLPRACGVPAVCVRAVNCWQWRSGHYSHQSFLFFFFFFPPLSPCLIEGVLRSKHLFSESCTWPKIRIFHIFFPVHQFEQEKRPPMKLGIDVQKYRETEEVVLKPYIKMFPNVFLFYEFWNLP